MSLFERFGTKTAQFVPISKHMKSNIFSKKHQIDCQLVSNWRQFCNSTPRLWREKKLVFDVWALSDDLTQRRCHFWAFWTKTAQFVRISKHMKSNIFSKKHQIYCQFVSNWRQFCNSTPRLWREKSLFFDVWALSDDFTQRRCHVLSVLDKKSSICSNCKTYEI